MRYASKMILPETRCPEGRFHFATSHHDVATAEGEGSFCCHFLHEKAMLFSSQRLTALLFQRSKGSWLNGSKTNRSLEIRWSLFASLELIDSTPHPMILKNLENADEIQACTQCTFLNGLKRSLIHGSLICLRILYDFVDFFIRMMSSMTIACFLHSCACQDKLVVLHVGAVCAIWMQKVEFCRAGGFNFSPWRSYRNQSDCSLFVVRHGKTWHTPQMADASLGTLWHHENRARVGHGRKRGEPAVAWKMKTLSCFGVKVARQKPSKRDCVKNSAVGRMTWTPSAICTVDSR